MNSDASYWIRQLGLSHHPGGGYYKVTFRSSAAEESNESQNFQTGGMVFSWNTIYYLLDHEEFSPFHRIKADEIWHFYLGSPITIYSINPEGMLFEKKLGQNPANRELFQAHMIAGHWFAASVENEDSYALVGCTIAPGINFSQFEIGRRNGLISRFPRHKDLIMRFTKE